MQAKDPKDLISDNERKFISESIGLGATNEDHYFLLKFQIVLLIASSYAFLTIFYPGFVASRAIELQQVYGQSLELVLFLRGCFITGCIVFTIYSYKTSSHMPLVVGSIAVIASFNLVTDTLVVYWRGLADLNLSTYLIVFMRLLATVLTICSIETWKISLPVREFYYRNA